MLARGLACFSCLIVAVWASAQPAMDPRTADVDPAVFRLLAEIRAADKGQLAVSEEDGRFPRVLAASTNAKLVLEIGAASGYEGTSMTYGKRER